MLQVISLLHLSTSHLRIFTHTPLLEQCIKRPEPITDHRLHSATINQAATSVFFFSRHHRWYDPPSSERWWMGGGCCDLSNICLATLRQIKTLLDSYMEMFILYVSAFHSPPTPIRCPWAMCQAMPKTPTISRYTHSEHTQWIQVLC